VFSLDEAEHPNAFVRPQLQRRAVADRAADQTVLASQATMVTVSKFLGNPGDLLIAVISGDAVSA
jgi:hypothetical protein